MFETGMITLREGLEAFLIVAILFTYLAKTGGEKLIPAVRAACITTVLACALLGVVLAKVGAMTPLWEGVLALVAAFLVISCTVHMFKMGKHMKKEITTAVDQALINPGTGAKVGIFLFVLLMIGREGLEASTMIAALAQNNAGTSLAIGGVLGLLAAGAIAWAWTRYGRYVNLGLFFQVTAVFMILFAIQLVILAFHEFTESAEIAKLGWFNTQYWHEASEEWGPQGRIGAWISYSLVLAPLAFLAAGLFKANGTNSATSPAQS